jgi:Carboxypeptidase regulatory-like domain
MSRTLSLYARAALAAAVFALLLPASVGALPQAVPQPGSTVSSPSSPDSAATQQNSGNLAPGTITGTVLDESGAIVAGAHVQLTRSDRSAPLEVLTDNNGAFSFVNVAPGPFQITASLPGFAMQTASGTVRAGDTFIVPPITLALAAVSTRIEVMPQEEVAEAQIKEQEKQRVLGVVPNFYVTYLPDAVPLTAKQKYQLAWKSTVDPITLALTGAIAGIQQGEGEYSGFGGGVSGYAKRYGAAYGDVVAGTFLSGAVFPSIFKQDPRYFYKGVGSVRFRLLYALANAVICKGDDRRWQPNYSNIFGNLAAGGISNLYYPSQNRNGAALTFESALIGIGATAAGNVLEEFVIKKLTPNLPNEDSDKSSHKVSRFIGAFAQEGT